MTGKTERSLCWLITCPLSRYWEIQAKVVKPDHTSDKRTHKVPSGLQPCWASCHPFRQWKPQRKRLMPVRCIAQSHKPQGNVICCDNWEQTRHWPLIHQDVPAGITSPLCSQGATQGQLWGHQGMMLSSDCACPGCPMVWPGKDAQLRLGTAPGAQPPPGISSRRSSAEWHRPQNTFAFRCASLCPCTDWP